MSARITLLLTSVSLGHLPSTLPPTRYTWFPNRRTTEAAVRHLQTAINACMLLAFQMAAKNLVVPWTSPPLSQCPEQGMDLPAEWCRSNPEERINDLDSRWLTELCTSHGRRTATTAHITVGSSDSTKLRSAYPVS